MRVLIIRISLLIFCLLLGGLAAPLHAQVTIDFTGQDTCCAATSLTIGNYTLRVTDNDVLTNSDTIIVDANLADFGYNSSAIMPVNGYVASDITIERTSGTFNLNRVRLINWNNTTETIRIIGTVSGGGTVQADIPVNGDTAYLETGSFGSFTNLTLVRFGAGSTPDNFAVDDIEVQQYFAEPVVLNLNGDGFTYSEGDGGRVLDQGTAATLTDADSTNFNTGNLTVRIITGEDAAEDLLGINTAGAVSLNGITAGSTVSVSGVAVGTLANNISAGNDFVVNLTANATIARVQTLLQSVSYTNNDTSNPTVGTRSVRVSVTDNDGAVSNFSDVAVTVQAVNDAPTFSNLNGDFLNYNEGDGQVALDQSANATLGDVDSVDFDGGNVTVTVVSGLDGAEDQLSVFTSGAVSLAGTTSGSNVSVSGFVIGSLANNIGPGTNFVVNLNSSATPARIQELVRQLSYENIDTANPTPGTRTVRVTVSDGDGGTSANQDVSVTVAAVNDPPSFTNLNGDSFTYTEGDGTVVLDQASNSTVTDVDSAEFNGGTLTVTITSGEDAAEDLLTVSTSGSISLAGTTSGSNVSVSSVIVGTLDQNISAGNDFAVNLNGNATPARIQDLVRALAYSNSDTNNPTTGARNVRVTLSDGDGHTSSNQDITVTVQGSNDVPQFTNLNGDSLTYTEGSGAVVLDQAPSLTVNDVDNSNFNTGNITVAVVAGADAAEDVLSFSTSGTVSLSATTSGSNVLVGGVVVGTLDNNIAAGNNLVVTLNTNATPARIQTLAQAATYENSDTSAPTTGARTVRFTLNDGSGGTSSNQDVTVTVQGANDVPTIANLGGDSLTYNEGSGAVILDQGGNATASDVDSTDFNGGNLTVTIISGEDAAEDQLSVNTSGTVSLAGTTSGSSVSVGGTPIGTLGGTIGVGSDFVISLSSGANPSRLQTVIRALTYENTDTDNPTAGARTVRVTLSDGDGGTSANQDVTVTVQRVNDAPTIDNLGGDSLTYSEGDSLTLLDQSTALTLADVDSADFNSGNLTVSVTSGADLAEDQLSLDTSGAVALAGTTSGSNVSVSSTVVGTLGNNFAAGNDLVVNFNANATPSLIQTLLRAVGYQNLDTANPTTGARNVRITVNDGDGGTSANQDVTVTVQRVNDAPVLSNLNGDSFTFLEGASPAAADQGGDVTVGDVDSANFSGGVLTAKIATNKVASEDLLGIDTSGVVALAGTTSGSNVSVSSTVVGTLANAISVGNDLVINLGANANSTNMATLIKAITYQNSNTTTPDGSNRTLRITLSDGDGGTSSNSDVTISVQDVNDEPAVVATPLSPGFSQGGAAVALYSGASVDTIESTQSTSSITLTVSSVVDSGEILSVDGTDIALVNGGSGSTTGNSLTYSVGVAAGTATVTISGGTLNKSTIDGILDSISYQNTGTSITSGARVVTLTGLQDSGGTANGGDDTVSLSLASSVNVVAATATPVPTSPPVTTSTFTPTATPVSTTTAASPTPTVAQTVSVTPVASPSPTATVAATVTPTPTASASPTPLVTPTPTATPKPDVVSGRVIVDGVPQAGVLVYIPDLGVSITNENGEFEIEGAREGVIYQAFVQRTGVAFEAESYSVSSTEKPDIAGAFVEYNPVNCEESDLSSSLNKAGENAENIYERALKAGQKLKGKRLVRRLEKRFNRYLSTSRGVPEVILDCSMVENSGCEQSRLRSKTRKMDRVTRGLSKMALRIDEQLGKFKGRRKGRSKLYQNRVRRNARRVRKTLRRLPRRTYLCNEST